MGKNTILYLVVGALVVYVLMSNQTAQAYGNNLPAGGTTPAGDPVLGVVQGGLDFINNVFGALKTSSTSQSQPKSN